MTPWAWISHKLSAAWVVVAGAVIIVVTIAGIFFRALAAGRDKERAEARGKILKDVEKRHEVDRTVARTADPAGELQRDWSRD